MHDFGKYRKQFDENCKLESALILNVSKHKARQIDINHRKIIIKNELF